MRIPTRDMLADLRNETADEFGDGENACTATNRQLRLYVGGYMLTDSDDLADLAEGVGRARKLYEGSGRPQLLDAPGRLTTAGIAAEVAQLVRPDPDADGR